MRVEREKGLTHHLHSGLCLAVVVEDLLPVPQMNTDLEDSQRGHFPPRPSSHVCVCAAIDL